MLPLLSKTLSTSETIIRTVNKCAHISVVCLRAEKGRVEVIPRTALFNFHCQSRSATENVVGFMKKGVSIITRFLYRSRKIILLILVVVLVTLVFSFLMAPLVNNDASNNANNGANDEINDRTIPTTGTIYVSGLEIYGGDIKSESEKVYVDWGELTLGASKNATFYVRSTSNVDVELGLNVTNWIPSGIEEYLDISWDYNGTMLSSGPDQVPLLVTVNLTVASNEEFIDFIVENNVTSFGFDMTVYASGV